MSMIFERKLPIPMEVKERYPLTYELESVVKSRAAEIKDIFTGKSDKLVLVIGPCSADNEDSVIDYISRLREVQEKVKTSIETMTNLEVVDVNVRIASVVVPAAE